MIPLTSSWTNSNLTIRALDNPSSVFGRKQEALWADPSGKSFYLWGGEAPYGRGPSEKSELWQYTVDNAGGNGSWAQATPSNLDAFSLLIRPGGGARATSKDTGFVLGGYASAWTDKRVTGQYSTPLPGLVSFNMTSLTWRNHSTTPFTRFGTQIFGQAEWIPSFGPNGLLTFLGGSTTATLEPIQNLQSGSDLLSFNNITLYDPVDGTWFSQQATGDIPAPRDTFCSAGAQGNNGTYDMYAIRTTPYRGFSLTPYAELSLAASTAPLVKPWTIHIFSACLALSGSRPSTAPTAHGVSTPAIISAKARLSVSEE